MFGHFKSGDRFEALERPVGKDKEKDQGAVSRAQILLKRRYIS